MDLIHEKKGDLYLCKLCQHSYQTSTTYRAHYKNNQCYPTEDAPKDIVEDDNEEEEQQQQGQQQQEKQQVLVAGAPSCRSYSHGGFLKRRLPVNLARL